MTWAQRLKRVVNIDIETCKTGGGDVKITACIRVQGCRRYDPRDGGGRATQETRAESSAGSSCREDAVVIEKILTHLERKDASAAVPRLPPCRAPLQASPGAAPSQLVRLIPTSPHEHDQRLRHRRGGTTAGMQEVEQRREQLPRVAVVPTVRILVKSR